MSRWMGRVIEYGVSYDGGVGWDGVG
jgi:hypothetical protein